MTAARDRLVNLHKAFADAGRQQPDTQQCQYIHPQETNCSAPSLLASHVRIVFVGETSALSAFALFANLQYHLEMFL